MQVDYSATIQWDMGFPNSEQPQTGAIPSGGRTPNPSMLSVACALSECLLLMFILPTAKMNCSKACIINFCLKRIQLVQFSIEQRNIQSCVVMMQIRGTFVFAFYLPSVKLQCSPGMAHTACFSIFHLEMEYVALLVIDRRKTFQRFISRRFVEFTLSYKTLFKKKTLVCCYYGLLLQQRYWLMRM